MKLIIDMQGAQLEKEPRGIARYMICMIREMLKHPRGHEIKLLFNGGFEESIARITKYLDLDKSQVIVWMPAFPQDKGYYKTPWRIAVDDAIHESWVRSLSPDLFLSMSCFAPPYSGFNLKIGDLPRAYPIVYTLHDLIPLAFPKLYLDTNPFAAKIFLDQVENSKKADGWITISDYSAQEGIQYLGLTPEKIYNASEGADEFFHRVEFTQEATQQFKNRFGIRDRFLLYVGGGDPRKNIPSLIQAYESLSSDIKARCQLVIAGKLPASIFPKTDSDRIVLTGYIDDETLRSLYSLSTAFVFPTLAEGFGLPALEAMSCGTAVICSGGSSLVEVVNNPQAYFDPYSIESIAAKMKQVIEDPEFRAELISKGTEQAKQFSWASSAEKALIFLEQVRERYPQTDVSSPDPVDCLIKQIAVLKRRPTEQELFALTRAITLRA